LPSYNYNDEDAASAYQYSYLPTYDYSGEDDTIKVIAESYVPTGNGFSYKEFVDDS